MVMECVMHALIRDLTPPLVQRARYNALVLRQAQDEG
jgi:hypothetical protein